jgi:hypothetical protein
MSPREIDKLNNQPEETHADGNNDPYAQNNIPYNANMDPSNGKRRNPRVAYLNKNTSV